MKESTSPSVLMLAISETSTSGIQGFSSLMLEKISTRLMESMPRSVSRPMSMERISRGYPVFSATTFNTIS